MDSATYKRRVAASSSAWGWFDTAFLPAVHTNFYHSVTSCLRISTYFENNQEIKDALSHFLTIRYYVGKILYSI